MTVRIFQNFLVLFAALFSHAQQITCSPEDKQTFENKTIEIDGLLENDFGKTIVAIGTTFTGIPLKFKR